VLYKSTQRLRRKPGGSSWGVQRASDGQPAAQQWYSWENVEKPCFFPELFGDFHSARILHLASFTTSTHCARLRSSRLRYRKKSAPILLAVVLPLNFCQQLHDTMLSDSEEEDVTQLTINEHYAKAYAHRKEREELQKRALFPVCPASSHVHSIFLPVF
jgi:hypothetical protein